MMFLLKLLYSKIKNSAKDFCLEYDDGIEGKCFEITFDDADDLKSHYFTWELA